MAVVTLVLDGQNLMAFAEAVNAEFPGFEMSCEMVSDGVVRGPLDRTQSVVIKIATIALAAMPIVTTVGKTVEVAGKAVDVVDHAVEVVDKSVDMADKWTAFLKRWNIQLDKAVVIPEEGDRQVLIDTSLDIVLETARSIG